LNWGSISYFNKLDIGGRQWIVSYSKSTKEKTAENDGKAWTLAVRASMFHASPLKDSLWQASAEDQLRNFGMHSFVTVQAD